MNELRMVTVLAAWLGSSVSVEPPPDAPIRSVPPRRGVDWAAAGDGRARSAPPTPSAAAPARKSRRVGSICERCFVTRLSVDIRLPLPFWLPARATANRRMLLSARADERYAVSCEGFPIVG